MFISLVSVVINAQNQRITGFVADEKGEPLPGAAVAVKGTPRGVTTDADGTFSIEVKSTDILEISFLGYEILPVTVGQQTYISVKLEPKKNDLDEVTIVAFGRQKKASVVSSIQTVNTKDLKISSSNLTTAFAGKIPGVISYQTTGEPGADNAQFFVRGVTTFGYKTSPLILIDGFEATSDDLARLQPDDIESFSILKDASATVLYGARGANGIIVVSTKSGREGPVKLSARVDVNTAMPTKTMELLDGVEYMRLYNQASTSRNPQAIPYYSEQKIQSTANGENPMIYPNINWYDKLFNTYTMNTKANLNISGGGKVATYYVAGGYDHETGLLKVDKLSNFNNNIAIDRFHIRTNVIFNLTPTTRLDTRIQGRFEKYNGPYNSASDIYKMVMDANPVDFPAVWNPDPAHQYVKNTLFGNLMTADAKKNPYAEMVRGYDERNESTLTTQATLLQDLNFLTEGLKLQLKVSANTWSYYSGKRTYQPLYYVLNSYDDITDEYTLFNTNPNANPYLGNVTPIRDGSSHFYYEARLNWDRRFGLHSIGAMTVATAEEYLLTAGNSNNIYETLPERNLGNSGRITYDYDSRYFFEFAYGYNGSEKFDKKHRFGFFPSVGFGYLVSNEKFWMPLKDVVSLLKLRFTYGKVGNDAISGRSGRFFYLSNINSGGGVYQWGPGFLEIHNGFSIDRYANPDITWEVSTKYNLGLDLGFFKDESLKLQIDVFKDIRDKIYLPRENFPSTAGFETTISGNVGKVESKGIDASADYQHFFSKDLWLTGRANITYSTNKYLELDEKDYADEYLKKVGYNINQTWGYVAERLFVDDLEIAHSPSQTSFGTYTAGDIKYRDLNGDGVINSNDRIAMGYPTIPEIQYGFGLSSGYKNFDLSFFFQGNARVSFYIQPEQITPLVNRRNAPAIVARDSWSVTNPDVHAFWPRLSVEQINNNTQQSSWWLRDGKFIRLKTVEMGYNIKGYKKIGLESCRVYISGENIFVLSPFKLWDPEMGGNGLAYPLNRRFNVGFQLFF
ncbi:MAG: TonB-dependent receptor [Tannerella sp.]|nr:TonB-dependent receptor [Tannerella sp.]